MGRKTAPVPGRKTAYKGTPLKVHPKGTPILSSPSARSGEPSRSKGSKADTTAATTAGASWSREACQDWIDRFGGTANGGRIGRSLKPLVEKHGWPQVREAWCSYLKQAQAEYATPERFAVTYGEWSGPISKVATMPRGPERVLEAAMRFIAAGEAKS